MAASDARPDPGSRRLLLILEDLGGGTGNHLCRMLRHWELEGWQITVVTQTPPLVSDLPADLDIRVASMGGGRLSRFPFAQIRRLLELGRLVRDTRPDVVHTYFFWSIVYGRILKLLGLVPTLVENREDLGFSWGRGSYAVLRLTAWIPDRVICVADAVRRVVLQREHLSGDRVTVIRNGVDAARRTRVSRLEARRRSGFEAEHVVVGMVANLQRTIKGGDRLLAAAAPILERAPNVRFLVVGLGTEASVLEPELRRRGVAESFVCAGYRTDVDAWYAAMDISVLTSLSEGLSITVLESMWHGLPLVVTAVGGNTEAVIDGETGFVVPAEDVDAFVDAVVRLAQDEAMRRRLGSAGRLRATSQFALQHVARRYLAVYEEALGGPTPHDVDRDVELNDTRVQVSEG